LTFQLFSGWTLAQAVLGALAVLAAAKFAGKPEEGNRGRKRIGEFDFAKGIAIVSVILLHIQFLPDSGPQTIEAFSFGVEVFILASGYLLCKKYSEGLGWKKYLNGIAWRIVAPYAAFTFVMHVVHYHGLNLPELALDLVFGRANGGNLYFIPVILQFYLLFPLMMGFRRHFSKPLALALLYAACAFVIFWDWQIRQPAWNSNIVALAIFPRYLFYFVFGIFLASYGVEAWSAKKLALFSLLFLASVAAQSLAVGQFFIGQNYALFAFFGSLAAAGVFKRLLPCAYSAIGWAGKYSLWVYFVHPVVISNLQQALPAMSGIAGYAEISILAIAISCAVVWAGRRSYLFLGLHPS